MTSNKEDGVNYTGVSPEKPIKKEPVPKFDDGLDLNKDGKFDEKDASIAGKILAKSKSKRKKVK